MSNSWEIRVESGSYYPSMCEHSSGHDISYCYEHDDHTGYHFYAYSRHVDALSDHEAISNRLASLEVIVNGVMRILSHNIDVYPTKFLGYLSNGASSYLGLAPRKFEEFPFELALVPEVIVDEGEHIDINSLMLSLCMKDECIRYLCILVGMIKERNFEDIILAWNTLFKIYDTVKYFACKEEWRVSEFASVSQLNAFSTSCNNISIIGVNARHGHKPAQAPKKILSFEESKKLIFDMSCGFIVRYTREKYDIQLP